MICKDFPIRSSHLVLGEMCCSGEWQNEQHTYKEVGRYDNEYETSEKKQKHKNCHRKALVKRKINGKQKKNCFLSWKVPSTLFIPGLKDIAAGMSNRYKPFLALPNSLLTQQRVLNKTDSLRNVLYINVSHANQQDK